jgi:hypothetical protein
MKAIAPRGRFSARFWAAALLVDMPRGGRRSCRCRNPAEPMPRNSVLTVGLLAGLRGLPMRVVSAVQPVALHGLGCLAIPSMPRSTGAFRLLSRHPLAAPLLAHTGTACPRHLEMALRHAKDFEKCGRSRIRTYETPRLVRRNRAGNLPSSQRRLIHVTCGNHAWKCPGVPGRVCAVVPASGSRAIWHRGLPGPPQNSGHRRSRRDDRPASRRSDHPPAGRRRAKKRAPALLAPAISASAIACSVAWVTVVCRRC